MSRSSSVPTGMTSRLRRCAPLRAREVFVQRERLGTAHAVLAAREAIERGYDDILVTYADIPLLRGETLAAHARGPRRGRRARRARLRAADPAGYGRLIERDGRLVAIREDKDANADEKAARLCNAGPIAFGGAEALALLDAVTPTTRRASIISPTSSRSRTRAGLQRGRSRLTRPRSWGSTTASQLAAAEAAMQARLRRRAMLEGATLVAPETVFLSFDTTIGRDVAHRAACRDRPRRHDRGRRRHPRLLASRGRAGREPARRSGPSRD